MIKDSRQIDFLFEQDIWIIGITISYVRTKIALSWDKLVSEETSSLFRQFKIKPPSIPFSDIVANGHEKLRYKAAVIKQRHLVYAEPFWFMPNSRWEQFTADFESLKALCNSIKQDMIDNIEVIREEYFDKVERLIDHIAATTASAPDSEELNTISKLLKERMITVDEIDSQISVEMLPPICIQAFAKQAEQRASLKVATAEAERAKMIAAATASAVEQIRRSTETAIKDVRNQVISTVTECLDLMEAGLDCNMTSQNRQRINSRLEKLSLLVNFADNDMAKLISEVCSNNGETAASKVNELRLKLQKYVSGKASNSIAHAIKL